MFAGGGVGLPLGSTFERRTQPGAPTMAIIANATSEARKNPCFTSVLPKKERPSVIPPGLSSALRRYCAVPRVDNLSNGGAPRKFRMRQIGARVDNRDRHRSTRCSRKR
jgi:hypothetical protein